ncbi:uncharacterized protein LOC107615570 [Arachis ipaensis]|uniref:uncharacterized protein LOC107615570 n=1 Tax=Arachis ipaensis TaxID=130454 RepID=UPI0007AF2E3D|nr:uncharacterized protein LOC107615570 [Arachis ipaensis]XP_025678541.1 uncharacterized protein LOC112778442 [Arachis hypogaea]
MAEREPNTLPSDTIPNPKEECKVVQLKSKRTLVNDKETNKKPVENHEAINKEQMTVKDKQDQEKLKEKEEPQASKKGKQAIEEQSQEQRTMVKTHIPPLPYPQRFNRELKDQQFLNAVIQRGLPPKLKDPGSFILSCTMGNKTLDKALCDLGASINLMPLSIMKKLAIEEVKPTRMSLQMADRSLKIPNGIVENLLVKIGEFIFPTDFIILDMKEEGHSSVILGRPFLAIARAIIDVEKGEMTLRVHDEKMIINVFKAMQHPLEKEKHMRVEMIEEVEEELLEDED